MTERQRDRKTERQKDRETEREIELKRYRKADKVTKLKERARNTESESL